MGQLPQLQPQEDFPCFLSFLMLITIPTMTAARIRLTRIVPALSIIP